MFIKKIINKLFGKYIVFGLERLVLDTILLLSSEYRVKNNDNTPSRVYINRQTFELLGRPKSIYQLKVHITKSFKIEVK